MVCEAGAAAGLFNNIWTILGFVASIIVFCIIMVILVKYCWQFRTKNNKEHVKKLKTNDNAQRPRKNKLNNPKDVMV